MTADAVGGVWQYSVDLARELSNRGCEVLIAVLGPAPDRVQTQQLAEISRIHLASSPYALEWMENPWEDVAQARDWLLHLERSFHPNIAHLNGYVLADAPWLAPALVVAHSCVLSWWKAVHGTPPPSDWDEYERRVRRGLQVASAVVAPSRFMADSIASTYCVEPDAITVIPNFSSAIIASPARKEPFFLASGRIWDKAKNIAFLESMAPELAWPLTIAGSESINGAPRSKTARHLGRLSHSDLCEQMSRAAVYAHPALYEPFGLSVLEAARAGCCLMLADIPSLRELWGNTAVYANPRDRESWITKLNELAANEALREEMSRRAAGHAQHYTSTASLDQYCALYERLLGSTNRRPEEAA